MLCPLTNKACTTDCPLCVATVKKVFTENVFKTIYDEITQYYCAIALSAKPDEDSQVKFLYNEVAEPISERKYTV